MMKSKKKSKLLILVGVLIAGTPIFASYVLSNNYKNDFIQSIEQEHIATISNMEIGFKEFSLKHSTLISHMITSSNAKKEEIQAYLKSEYHNLNDLGLDQIQIIDKDGYSIARVNDVKLIGQNLLHRPLIKKALESGVIEEWFEDGLVRSGYRFLYPVIKDEKTTHLIEFVLSLDEVKKRLKALHGDTINIVNPAEFMYNHKEFDNIMPIKDSSGQLYAFSVLTPTDEQLNSLSTKIRTTQNIAVIIFLSLILLFLIHERVFRLNEKKIDELHDERKIFDNGPVMLFHWNNFHGWTVTYVSKTVESILGYKEKEALSQEFNYLDLIHPEDKQRIAMQVEENIASGSDKYKQEYRIRKADGAYIHVTDYTYLMRDESGDPIKLIGYLVDQSEYLDKDYQLLLSDIIINESNEVIVLADKDGNITYLNDAFSKVCKYLNPKHILQIFPDIDLTKSWTKEIDIINPDGKKMYFSANFSIIDKNDNIRLLLIFRDITDIKEANERFTYITTHDSLTQAKNKYAIWFDMFSMVKKQEPFSVFCVQIDNLKKTVDIYGHILGDIIIKHVYEKLSDYSKGKDHIIGRLEEKQFIVLMSSVDDLYINNAITEIREILSKEIIVNDSHFSVDISIGSLIFPIDLSMPDNIVYEETTNDIVRLVSIAVDTAHKEAKGYLPYHLSMLEAIQLKEERIKQIDNCIKNGFEGLDMVYQPKYHCTGDDGLIDCKHLVGFEALLRCNFMPLYYFISIAEENGTILDIGKFVIETVISDVKSWINEGYNLEDIRVSFNVSAIQLSNQDVNKIILDALNENEIEGRYFEMEITESKIIDNFEKVKSVIEFVKTLGIKVSIDDFGTGYSNLKSLLAMPVDTIKIDRSFVQNMEVSENTQAIIHTIIGMASSMKATTIAEGVEKAEEVEILIKAGNRNFQGYFFDYPLEIDAVKERLNQRLLK